jgi:hypothetical protein
MLREKIMRINCPSLKLNPSGIWDKISSIDIFFNTLLSPAFFGTSGKEFEISSTEIFEFSLSLCSF